MNDAKAFSLSSTEKELTSTSSKLPHRRHLPEKNLYTNNFLSPGMTDAQGGM
jgi:hypothetical protein